METDYSFDGEGIIAETKALWATWNELGEIHGREFAYKAVELTPEDQPVITAYCDAVVDVYMDMFNAPDVEAPHAYVTNYGHWKGLYCHESTLINDGDDLAPENSLSRHYIHAANRIVHDFTGKSTVFIAPSNKIAENAWVLAHEYAHWADDALLDKQEYKLDTDTGDALTDNTNRFLNAFRTEIPGQVLGYHALNVLARDDPVLDSWFYHHTLPKIRESYEEHDDAFATEFGFSATDIVRDPAKLTEFVEKASDHIPGSSCVFFNAFRPIFERARPQYKAFYEELRTEYARLWEGSTLTPERAATQKYYSKTELIETAAELIRKDDFFEDGHNEYWQHRVKELGEDGAREEMIEHLREHVERESRYHRDRRFEDAVNIIEFLLPASYTLTDEAVDRMKQRFDAFDCLEMVRGIYALEDRMDPVE
ncbi:MAG: hypothetical protein QGG26_06115 [Candidatus Undinarchaeales archaeon]|nr:hypothetical protein [Candidatus Undinarchaeales archaeon]